jgi:hypothetical protein
MNKDIELIELKDLAHEVVQWQELVNTRSTSVFHKFPAIYLLVE